MSQVDKRSGLTWSEFYNDYVIPNKPVVITDAASEWKALELFNPDFFLTTFPDKTATIKGVTYTLQDYIRLMNESTPEDPAPYPFKIEIDNRFPEIIPYVEKGFEILKKNRLKSPLFTDRLIPMASTKEIFFGGPGGWFPYIHYDLYGMYAIVTQVVGSKQFTLWEPDQEKYLYVSEEDPWMSTIEDYHKADPQKYPLFSNARSQSVTVEPGETIFVPLGYWHTARSMESTISIAQDLLTDRNWEVFRRDAVFYKRKHSLVKAMILDMYIRFIGTCMGLHERVINAY
jgi:hypothetical protein